MKVYSRSLYLIFFILLYRPIHAQNLKNEDFGVREIDFNYKGETIRALVYSKHGDSRKPKPIFLFCQGSQPKPLLIFDKDKKFGIFPFNPDSLANDFHLIIISKPGVPILAEQSQLNNFNFLDENGQVFWEYGSKNYRDYYVDRNIFILKKLRAEPWVAPNKLVVAGHSEGSSVVAKMATRYKKITHLIYASGNPMGRIMSMIGQRRAVEKRSDTLKLGENEIEYWREIVEDHENLDTKYGDSYKATFQFSEPTIDEIEKLKIPVLVSYGTKDISCPFNDFMRVDFIRKQKSNVSFQAYVGLEHNFFVVNENGAIDYSEYNWNKVVSDWKTWINTF